MKTIENDIFVLDEKMVSVESETKPENKPPAKNAGLTEQVVKKMKNAFLRGDDEIEIKDSPFVIGKDEKCSYQIKGDTYISRKHCRITRRGEDFFIEDLGSTNGTFVDGKEIDERTKLENGQEIKLADRCYIWEE